VRLRCLKQGDSQLAAAFAQLARTVAATPVPGPARYASADLAEAARQAAASLQMVHAVRTLPQYQQVVASWPILQDDVQVEHDYGYLRHVLGSGAAGPPATSRPDVTGIVLAGDSYGHGAVVYAALQKLIQGCMIRQHLTYHRAAWEPAPAQSNAPLHTDIDALRRAGYGLYDAVAAGRQKKPLGPPDLNLAYLKSRTPPQRQRWNTALSSGPELSMTIPDGSQSAVQLGGCSAQSYNQIYGSYEKWRAVDSYVADIETKVTTEALWSPEWRSAQGGWARCMSSHGFRYATEAGVVHGLSARYQAAGARLRGVHRLELRTARQDAACTSQARLNQAGLAAIRQVAASLPADQLSALRTWQVMRARGYSAAIRVLAR
jgi:hypothetical protein